MSKTLTVMRRIRAYHAGRPLPLGETKHLPLAAPADILALAFVRMGGESAPWGLAWQRGNESEPQIAICPEPRDRALVIPMLLRFVPTLLDWLGHPSVTKIGAGDRAGSWGTKPFRQLWLPNPTHIEMLHFLAYAYTYAKRGEPGTVEQLTALGRAANWLFRESNRPGQVTVFAATDALRSAYAFPAEDARQGHLGYLLGWLGDGDRATRATRAHAAEGQAVSTSLDPHLERKALTHLVEEFGALKREAKHDSGRGQEIADRIRKLIAPELTRRVALTLSAIDVLRADQRLENEGLIGLRNDTESGYDFDYLSTERRIRSGENAFVASPETDFNAAQAAAGYHVQTDAAEKANSILVHHDRVLQLEAVEGGTAISGLIVSVHDETKGRGTFPVWVVRDSGKTAVRLREGSNVCVAGLPGRSGKIRAITLRDTARDFEIEITGLKTLPRDKTAHSGVLKAADPKLKGTEVTLLSVAVTGLGAKKRKNVWDKTGPGAWLTHPAANNNATVAADEQPAAEE